MASPQIARINGPEAFLRAFPVSRETLDRLVTYAAMLKRWQKTINLVAPGTLNDVWHRHFADSAQIWALRPDEAKTWLDLGSGAGFPGLVLALALRFEEQATQAELLGLLRTEHRFENAPCGRAVTR